MKLTKVTKDILLLSFPIILAQLGNVLLGLTDTIMLGQYGKAELGAMGIANQIFFVISVIGMGVMTALTPIIAASKGAQKQKECGEFLRSGIELSFIISVLVCIVLVVISCNFHLLGQDKAINLHASKYLRIIGISVFPMLLFLALKHFNDGLSYSKPAVLITFVGVLVNYVLNWILIYGNLTFPALGATGAGIATLISRIIMALLLVLVVFKSSSIKVYLPPLISTYRTTPVIKKLLRLGLPTGFQIFFEVGAYAIAAIIAGWISLTALAVHQIAMGVIAIFYMIATGISVAGSVKVAQAFGQQDHDSIKKNGIMAIGITGLVMTFAGIAVFIFHKPIFSVFTSDPTILKSISEILMILLFFQIINSLQVSATGILKGVEDIKSTALFSLFTYWIIGIPLAYILGVHFHYSLKGVWEGLLIALMITSLFIYYRIIGSTFQKISKYENAELVDTQLKS